jgi:hypothetical protein
VNRVARTHFRLGLPTEVSSTTSRDAIKQRFGDEECHTPSETSTTPEVVRRESCLTGNTRHAAKSESSRNQLPIVVLEHAPGITMINIANARAASSKISLVK